MKGRAMRKSLNLLAAAALLAALGACSRQPAGGVTPDEERQLNEARDMVIDTSPDDRSVNAEDVAEENVPEPAPANSAGERTDNRQ
jgi:hypothetical protein